MAGEIRLGASLSEPEAPINRNRRVIFTLEDGSEVEVRLAADNEGLTVRNLGTYAPQGLIVSPQSGNSLWIGVH